MYPNALQKKIVRIAVLNLRDCNSRSPQRGSPDSYMYRPIRIIETQSQPMVQVLWFVIGVVRYFHPSKLVLGAIPGRLKQRRKKRALVKIIAAAFKQSQFRSFLRAEIMHVSNLVMHVIENPRRVIAQVPGQCQNVRGVCLGDGG